MVLDVTTGQTHELWSTPSRLFSCALAPDGKRIAFTSGEYSSEIAEVSLPDGRMSTLLLSRGSLSTFPKRSPCSTTLYVPLRNFIAKLR